MNQPVWSSQSVNQSIEDMRVGQILYSKPFGEFDHCQFHFFSSSFFLLSGNCYEEIRTFIHSFSPELRKDEPLLLILGAIALFHPDRPSLQLRGQIRAQQSLYYFLLHSYIRTKYGNNNVRDTEALYVQTTNKLDLLHLLNDRHISMFLDVNPRDVEPLLIEIFDLNIAIPVKMWLDMRKLFLLGSCWFLLSFFRGFFWPWQPASSMIRFLAPDGQALFRFLYQPWIDPTFSLWRINASLCFTAIY